MKLTKPQKALLSRTKVKPRDGVPFILLHTAADDRVAQNLAAKGIGYVVKNGWRYGWRKRSGYTNNFYTPPPCDSCGSLAVTTSGLIDTCLSCGAERA